MINTLTTGVSGAQHFTVASTDAGKATFNTPITVSATFNGTITDADTLAAAITSANIENVTADVDSQNRVTISHSQFGDIRFVDTDGSLTEAGFTDGNDDGLLGAESPPKVDGDGLVTSGLLNDGYNVPLDRDSDGNKDFQQYGQSIVNAVLDKTEIVLLESETGSFTIEASVPSGDLITYQWQYATSEGGVYFEVPEHAPFSGSQTKTLTITQPSVDYDGYRFRILLTIPSFVCQVAVSYTHLTLPTSDLV